MIQEIYNAFLQCDQKITTDTRKISDGCIFFALKGPNFDGNKFAEEAIKKGAKFAIIDQDEFYIKDQTFVVNDVLTFLQELALYHRKKFNIPIIGITGTNGKTTTKELIGAVLSSKYNIIITEGNLNNHIGVPLTLLQLNKEHEIGIIEMGASKVGDIKELAEIACPSHGIITNIGKAHLEGFGTIENIKKTKLELYDFIIANNGKIIVNNEDETLKNRIPSSIKQYTYGASSGDITGKIRAYHPTINISVDFNEKEITDINTALLGGYNLLNVLAAASIGKAFGISNILIGQSIESYVPTNNRSQLINTKNNSIIADCYNANPTSTIESLISFNAIENKNKLAILGDMLELGDQSEAEHQLICDYLTKKKIRSLLVGHYYCDTKSKFDKFKNTIDLITHLKELNLNDYIILLKGSRGIKLEEIITKNIL